MKHYAWAITKDFRQYYRDAQRGAPLPNAAGATGPVTSTYWQSLRDGGLPSPAWHNHLCNDGGRRTFHMFRDTDGVPQLCYEGYVVLNGDQQADGTEPLKDFGNAAGCNTITVFDTVPHTRYCRAENGVWVWR
jgi:hypothetical protein